MLSSRQSGAALESSKVPAKVELVKVTPVVLAEAPPPPPRPTPPKSALPARPVEPARPRPNPSQAPRTAPAPSAATELAQPAPARPPENGRSRAVPIAPAYPQAAARRPASSRPQASPSARPRTDRSEPRPSSPPPLWNPSPTPSPSEAGRSGPLTDPSLAGVVVEAYPLARIDVSTPKYMALRRVEIVARFEIAADGSTKVRLEPGTGIPAVDAEVLAYLQTIPWSPKTVGGVGVADVAELTFSKDGS